MRDFCGRAAGLGLSASLAVYSSGRWHKKLEVSQNTLPPTAVGLVICH
ncbi:hypothetical protein PLANPX_4876 [Lacipirellula parvula]|uniref:Uncharacterized protein n=1 Tax=Lacipirellula parvula TaxID=2650471 RepID=A0A5K7XEH3_9BACT|nr:hypothetical protein PLANPX_4876 [Lacipirellula parvula]